MRWIPGILVCLALAGCYGGHVNPMHQEGDSSMILGTGTIRHFDLEGGFFGIVGDDSVNYDPVGLAAKFQKDGLRVKFTGRPTNPSATRMWGKPIEIKSVEILP